MTKEQYQNCIRNSNDFEIIYNYYQDKTTIPLIIQDFTQFFNVYINLPIFDKGRVYHISPQTIFNNILKIAKDYYNNKFN